MRRRIFVEQFACDRAVMHGDAAHHVGHVLRAQAGQVYELSDGERVRLGRIIAARRDSVEFELLEEVPAFEPRVAIDLLPQFEALQKPEAIFRSSTAEVKLMLSERPQAPAIRTILEARRTVSSVALVIGPEGGWTDDELVSAEKAGFQPVSLGRLILRAETAAAAGLDMVNYALAGAKDAG